MCAILLLGKQCRIHNSESEFVQRNGSKKLINMEFVEELCQFGISILYFSISLSICLSVGVRKLQVAILARSSREMSLTDRIV